MILRRFLLSASLALMLFTGQLLADEAKLFSEADFAKLHRLIKPQPGESRWMEIDWHPTIWEARQRAAAEGKPLFLMAGSGGAPAAGC